MEKTNDVNELVEYLNLLDHLEFQYKACLIEVDKENQNAPMYDFSRPVLVEQITKGLLCFVVAFSTDGEIAYTALSNDDFYVLEEIGYLLN